MAATVSFRQALAMKRNIAIPYKSKTRNLCGTCNGRFRGVAHAGGSVHCGQLHTCMWNAATEAITQAACREDAWPRVRCTMLCRTKRASMK